MFPHKSPWSPRIFRLISLPREKWCYGEYGDIVTSLDTQIFKQLTLSFEHRTNIHRSIFLSKKVTLFIKYHEKQDKFQ
jgi:hypothetical protein